MLALAVGAVATTTEVTQAQVRVSFNIGRQPLWGPTGYDYAGYYYMPDIDAYYNIADQQFIYMDGGQWVFRSSLPYRYRNYDLYNGYKVVINDDRPWLRNTYYRRNYYGYRGRRGQGVIRDSRDYRYYENANHPFHNQWRGARAGNKSNDIHYRDNRGGGRDNRINNGGDHRDNNRGNRNDNMNNGHDRGNRGNNNGGNMQHGGGHRDGAKSGDR